MTATILIVEDEAAIRHGLRDFLTRSGYDVRTAPDLAQAHPQASGADLIVLDRRLPDGDGLELLAMLRKQGEVTPVIVLSAMGETNQRIDGFDVGADDYVTKPFDIAELGARIRAVLQRSQTTQPERGQLQFGECTLDIGARVVRRGSKQIELSQMEFKLLHYLRRHAGRAISRTELLDEVWGYDRFPTTRTIDYHILALRKKLEAKPNEPRHIITIHRVGYRFDP